jgi:hypothetical protein
MHTGARARPLEQRHRTWYLRRGRGRAGIPVLVQPMKNKDGARKVFGYAYIITGSFYGLGEALRCGVCVVAGIHVLYCRSCCCCWCYCC